MACSPAICFTRRVPSRVGALIMWLSSSAIYYSLVSPTYSHAASLLATSAFWYVLSSARGTAERRAAYACLGASRRLRCPDALAGRHPARLVPRSISLAARARAAMPSHATALIAAVRCAAGAAPLVFCAADDRSWTDAVWPAAGDAAGTPDSCAGRSRRCLAVLVPTGIGLFTWTPVVAIACSAALPFVSAPAIGIDRRLPRRRSVLMLSWYVNAAVADWWAGEAFGSRRFISCFPVFALALAALIDGWSPSVATACARHRASSWSHLSAAGPVPGVHARAAQTSPLSARAVTTCGWRASSCRRCPGWLAMSDRASRPG